jgi:hypothetical protein
MDSRMGVTDKVYMEVGKGFRDDLRMNGHFLAHLIGPDGEIKCSREVLNTVTTLGHKMSADQLLASPAVAKPGWMEVGTGSGQTAASTKLATYIAGSRTALDSKTRGENAIITMVCTMGAGVGTGAITEAGIFNVVTEDTTDLICYSSFSVINKAAGDALVITWTLTFA